MVTDEYPGSTGKDRSATIDTVVGKILVFGETSAGHVGAETFDDPVMHTYFLLYVFGALDTLAEADELDIRLTDDEKTAVMTDALLAFGSSSDAQVAATIRMLQRAQDQPALKMKKRGADAAREWQWGTNEAATRRFLEMLDDRSLFPENVPSSPGPIGSSS